MNDNVKKALKSCKSHVKKLGLKMHITSAKYNSAERKLVFTYEANKRVDFRELLRLLQNELNVKIELKQIGPRDTAKELGGLGPCGEVLCCTRFMKRFGPIGVRMMKQQGLTGSPQKFTGYCGKLMCCLAHEVPRNAGNRGGRNSNRGNSRSGNNNNRNNGGRQDNRNGGQNKSDNNNNGNKQQGNRQQENRGNNRGGNRNRLQPKRSCQ